MTDIVRTSLLYTARLVVLPWLLAWLVFIIVKITIEQIGYRRNNGIPPTDSLVHEPPPPPRRVTNAATGTASSEPRGQKAKQRYQSLYLRLSDGVRLALDIWLPPGVSESSTRVPVIFHQARYYR